MSQIPPDPEQRQPLNYERVTAGSGDAPAVHRHHLYTHRNRAAVWNFLVFDGQVANNCRPRSRRRARAVPATSAILQPAATQP